MTRGPFDIETVPNSRAKARAESYDIKAPANYKDPAKIEEAIRERRSKLAAEAALHWTTGQVVSIAIVAGDQKPEVFYGEDEVKVLTGFFDYVCSQPGLTLIGKNSDTFDIPYLIGRALAHDLGIPDCLRQGKAAYHLTDIDKIFGFGSMASQQGSLDDYAFGLQIPGKTGHATDVQNWYNQACLGDQSAWESMTKYNVQDVLIVHEMLRRWHKSYTPTYLANNAPTTDVTNIF